MLGYIYRTTCLINGKIYIGQTIKSLNIFYLGGGVQIRRAIKKYGKENFIKEILKQNVKTQKALDALEYMYIKKFDSNNPKIGYNILPGTANGFGGVNPMSIPEVRQRASISLKGNGKGKKKSPQHVIKLRKHLEQFQQKGRVVPQEQKIRISKNLKGRFSGILSPHFGTTWENYEERVEEMKQRQYIKVECYNPETLECMHVFNSIQEADSFIKKGSVSECIRGVNKTAGGYYWRKAV